MGWLDLHFTYKIGDGSHDLEHAVKGMDTEIHLRHEAAHEAAICFHAVPTQTSVSCESPRPD